MGSYHQMGHHSENLVLDPELTGFLGAILSPVDSTLEDVQRTMARIAAINRPFETIFDPQLYFPRTERERLRNWDYFPSDFETADSSILSWWQSINASLVQSINELGLDFICSPFISPTAFSEDAFSLMTEVAEDLEIRLAVTGTSVMQTAVVRLSDLSDINNVMALATILTRSSIERIYLILTGDRRPRRELANVDQLKGGMRLIQELVQANRRVLVAYSSTDVVLWKHSGAQDSATGKFFNLRRFTPSRWDDTDGGGGQLAYFCEESLLAYLRESDLVRVNAAGFTSDSTKSNPFLARILESISTGEAWISLGWKQYLHWFSEIEQRAQMGEDMSEIVRSADRTWELLDAEDLFMEERSNNGEWLRNWRRAISEF